MAMETRDPPSAEHRPTAAGTGRLRPCALLTTLVLLGGAAAGSAPAQEAKPAVRPGAASKDKTLKDYSTDCLRSGCHAGLNATPKVHAPVAVGACASCHE